MQSYLYIKLLDKLEKKKYPLKSAFEELQSSRIKIVTNEFLLLGGFFWTSNKKKSTGDPNIRVEIEQNNWIKQSIN